MLLRYSGSFGFALFITSGLFLTMQSLISQPGGIIETPKSSLDWSFIAEPREIEPPKKNRLVEPKRPPSPPPVEAPRFTAEPGNPGGIRTPMPPAVTPDDGTGISLVMTGRQPMPQITLAPQYPARLAQMGVEVHVDVGFDVDKLGKPTNIRIIESTHSAFEAAAVKALEKWRYRPVVVDGAPQAFYGLRKRFLFQLDE